MADLIQILVLDAKVRDVNLGAPPDQKWRSVRVDVSPHKSSIMTINQTIHACAEFLENGQPNSRIRDASRVQMAYELLRAAKEKDAVVRFFGSRPANGDRSFYFSGFSVVIDNEVRVFTF